MAKITDPGIFDMVNGWKFDTTENKIFHMPTLLVTDEAVPATRDEIAEMILLGEWEACKVTHHAEPTKVAHSVDGSFYVDPDTGKMMKLVPSGKIRPPEFNHTLDAGGVTMESLYTKLKEFWKSGGEL